MNRMFFPMAFFAVAFSACSGSQQSFQGNTGKVKSAGAAATENAVVAGQGSGTSTQSAASAEKLLCAGQSTTVTGDAGRKILFYAPDNYHYGTNQFAVSVRNGLQASGFDVTIVNSVTDTVRFDACNLYKSFRSIWFFLPCNANQVMDAASLDAVKKFYDFGGGMVLMADNHYFENSNANTHCSATNWDGSGNADTQRLGKTVFNVALKKGGTAATVSAFSGHALDSAGSALASAVRWSDQSIDAATSTAELKFLSTKSNGFGLIDAPFAAAQGIASKHLAVVLPSQYIYHGAASNSAIEGFKVVADYLDKNSLKGASVVAGASLSLTGAEIASALYKMKLPDVLPLNILKMKLDSREQHELSDAAIELAARGAVDLNSLVRLLAHDLFYVRNCAVEAIARHPNRAENVARLMAMLPVSQSTPVLAVGIVRALAALDAKESAPIMASLLLADVNEKVKSEIVIALAGFNKREYIGSIQGIATSSSLADLKTAAKIALGRLGVVDFSKLQLDSISKIENLTSE